MFKHGAYDEYKRHSTGSISLRPRPTRLAIHDASLVGRGLIRKPDRLFRRYIFIFGSACQSVMILRAPTYRCL